MRQCCGSPEQWSCGCSLAVRYLEPRRSRGPPTEGRGLGQRVARRIQPSPSFLRLGLQEGGENGAGDGQPHLRSDRNRSVGTGDRQPCRRRLLSEYTVRGPTQARTSFGADLVTVVVPDLLTKGERSLVPDGRADLVLDLRRAYEARRATISPAESKKSPDAAPTTSTPTSRPRASCSPQDNGHYRDNALASLGRCGSRRLVG
jgi:hypothetical protein